MFCLAVLPFFFLKNGILEMNDKQIKLQNVEPQPKYFAQQCPVCNGWGTVSFKKLTCHACSGKGYILILLEQKYEKAKI